MWNTILKLLKKKTISIYYLFIPFPGYKDKPTRVTDKALMSAFDTMKEPASSRQSLASEVDICTNGTDKDTPHVKKRHRRMKSSGVKKDGEEGEFSDFFLCFLIVYSRYWTVASI